MMTNRKLLIQKLFTPFFSFFLLSALVEPRSLYAAEETSVMDTATFAKDQEKSENRCLKTFEERLLAAEQGDGMAMIAVGAAYYLGDDVPQNFSESQRYYELAFKTQNEYVLGVLGVMYDRGVGGVPKDDEKAFQCFKIVAEKTGESQYLFNLGLMYRYGTGISRDLEKAVYYFNLAAEKLHPDALTNLGVMYLEGVGVSKDSEKALFYHP